MTTNLRFLSITDMLHRQAQDRSDHICFYYPNPTDPYAYATLTYKQFNDITNRLAQKLMGLFNLNQNDEVPVVALLSNSSVSYLLTIYALVKLHVIIYPLSIRNSEAAIMHLLKQSNVIHLFYSNDFSVMADKVRTNLSSVESHLIKDISIVELLQCKELTFELKLNINELDQVSFIMHRYISQKQ